MRINSIVIATLMFSVSMLQIKAREVAYKTIDGKWIKTKSEEWPKPKSNKGTFTIKTGGQITFTVTYLDVTNDTNIGFDDPVEGATRRAVVQEVLNYLNAVLDENGACDIEFSNSQMDASGALAHAGTYYALEELISPGDAFTHIVSGNDPALGAPDIVSTVDFGYNWFSSLSTTIPFTKYDLYSVILHEITHGLGVTSLISETGASEIFDKVYTTFDYYLHTSSGVKLISPTGDFQVSTSVLTGGSGGVHFRGPITMATFGGAVPLYTPDPYQPGSSGSHWSTALFPVPSMAPSFTNGTLRREYQPFEVAALADMFYHLRGVAVSSARNWMAYH